MQLVSLNCGFAPLGFAMTLIEGTHCTFTLTAAREGNQNTPYYHVSVVTKASACRALACT